jgi:hypothetical protein
MNDTNANLFDSIPEGLSRTVVNYCDAVEQLLGAVRYHYARMLQTAVTDSVQDQLKMLTIVAEVTAFVVTLDRLRWDHEQIPSRQVALARRETHLRPGSPRRRAREASVWTRRYRGLHFVCRRARSLRHNFVLALTRTRRGFTVPRVERYDSWSWRRWTASCHAFGNGDASGH